MTRYTPGAGSITGAKRFKMLNLYYMYDKMGNLTIRGVDDRVFREFKAEAVKDGTSIGKAITGAMKFWIESRKRPKKAVKSLLDLKPYDWGQGTEKASQEIDKILYGE